MTKKYPESWCRVIAAALIKSYEAGYKDGQDPASEEPWLMSTTTILDSLEEVGALKDIPEPLEIEFCVSHNAGKHSDSIGCFFRYNHPSERTIMCVFETMISKRAVE